MTEVGKLLYIVVEEDEETKGNEESSFRYTRPVLQSSLQLMGCKARHAFKISQRVFEIMRKKCSDDSLANVGVIQWGNDFFKVHPLKENSCDIDNQSDKSNGSNHMIPEKDGKPFDLYKKRTTIVVKRKIFVDVVCDALSEYKYVGPNQRADFVLACRIRERKESVTVLLCGTSGCGKSTLSALLAQSEMVIDSLDRLITAWEERKELVVVEGVHLSLNFVMGLMKKHPSIIPFMIYITNEDKHMERFAVRAKYMTLDPAKNKYVKYIRNIRTIQEYLCNRADKHLVPKINNTNVDKSVAAIHATVFSCLRRREAGEQLYDPTTNTVSVVDEEYRNQCAANSLGSKGMFQLIQRQGSTRHLMALLNNDGSVAKAWSAEDGLGVTMHEPLQIGKSESVNLQFGKFGISAWPTDLGCTSHASSVDDSKGELTDNGSKYYSSCCSSPKVSEGHAKELKEDTSVSGSDEEIDDTHEIDSDGDLSDDAKEHMHEEMEGSVDEESTKSDEEYDDLAMQDVQENGYFTDVELESFSNTSDNQHDTITTTRSDKYEQNLDHFLRTKRESVADSPAVNSKRLPSSGNLRTRGRSYSISASGKDEPLTGSLMVNSKKLLSSGSLRVRGRSYSISASGKDERVSPRVS
ncbi:hypothetical protein R6Q59_024361 [Mikania micrantha]